MERVLYLEPDEEITSVIDRIKKLKAKNIALVIPRDAVVIQSIVNLKLLQKEAEKLNKELAVVTSDRVGRNLASQVGLATFDKLEKEFLEPEEPELPQEVGEDEKAEGEEVKKEEAEDRVLEPKPHFEKKQVLIAPKPKILEETREKEIIPKKRMKLSKKLMIIGGVFSVFVIAFLAFLFLPRADIFLKVKAEKFKGAFDFTADKGAIDIDLEKNILPAQSVEATAEKEAKAQATGQKEIGAKAKGTVKVYNYYDSDSQVINAGTKFYKDGKTFLTTTKVTVPGFTFQAGNPVPGTAYVSLEAEKEGESYNVAAGKFTITGYPVDKFYAQSSSAMSGGYSKVVTVISQTDIDNLKNTLSNEASTEAINKLKSEIGSDKEILDNSAIIDVIDYTTSSKVNDQASEFTGKVKIKATALEYKRADFEKLAAENFKKKITADQKELVKIDYENMKKEIKSKDIDKMVIAVSGEGYAGPKLDEDKLKTNLMGKDKIRADEYLTSFSEIKSVQIDFSPFWVKKVPNFQKRVFIKIEYEAEATTSIEQ